MSKLPRSTFLPSERDVCTLSRELFEPVKTAKLRARVLLSKKKG
jgi:hypothetical protein